MTERSLQVTYEKGRTFAAYLHRTRPGRRAQRQWRRRTGFLSSTTEPRAGLSESRSRLLRRSLERRNQLLADLGEAPLAEQEYNPVRAA